MDQLRAADTFLTIAEFGSLTEASKRLGTSLPTVVRRLAEIEEHLGVRLFNRTTRRVEITEEGRTYLAACQRIKEEIAAVEQELTGKRSIPSGLVSITAPLRFGEMHVAPAVAAILEAYPELKIRLWLQDRNADLLADHIDIAVRIGHLRDSSLMVLKVGEVRTILCASPEFLSAYPAIKSPDDLGHIPCIEIDAYRLDSVWKFQKGSKQISVPISGRLVCNTTRPAVTACLNGLGVGRFLAYQVESEIRSGKLLVILEDFELPPSPLQLVYPSTRFLSARTRIVLDELAARLKQAVQAS
jgi:DNA-binding transcriptional LysR family regulator